MHVHTSLHSKCGRMTPLEMATQARAAGLSGVVITEHNAVWSDEQLAVLGDQFPDLIFLRGLEVSAQGYHVLVYGVTDTLGFEKGMPVPEVVQTAHQRRGVAVWAHPLSHSFTPAPAVMRAGFDACETQSMNIDPYEHYAYSQLAKRLGCPEMANSDAHHAVTLGTYATRFERPIRDEQELAAAIRAGAYASQERWPWSQRAWVLRHEYWQQQIRGMLSRGIADPLQIKSKTGASLQRINEVMAAK